jgi:hypothetical protein
MLFTVSVDLAEKGYFEFSTESIFHVAEIAQMLGNLDVVDEDEDFEDDECLEVPEELEHLFDENEEYAYDEDAECYCWYDEEYDAWYWLNEESGEWLLVEEEEEEEEAEEA